MRLLRRSKSSGDLPALATRFPAGLVRKLASQKESKVLALSSASIAFSIGSPFSNPRGTSADEGTSQGRDSGWHTAYAAARMAVEIAKESSDMFLPLKAVVGAISVLIQNSDQAADNAEAVKDIEQRVHSLSAVLTSPVSKDDHAEKARRMGLQRELERVLTKLEPLSEEHALLGFLRNVNNAKILAGFVQDLANAVVDYQVSIQQGVYERAREIHEETQNIHHETRNIREETRNIREEARTTHDVTKAIGRDTRNIMEASEVEMLAKLEPVPNAGYQGGHHEKCLPGTRESVLHDVLLWAKNPQGQNVFWLNGVAGAGKSTIAQSVSETLADDGLLGASFFCSRDYLNRRELKNIFPTLAHQLACRYSHFRNCVLDIIKRDPTKAHSSLVTQLKDLLVKPLSEENVACVIVIDALDECIDDQPASAILSVLARFVEELPLVKFFITGRPEPRIRTGFRLPLLYPLTRICILHEVVSAHVDKDIRLYLTQKLTAIAQRRSDVDLPNPWPSENEIVALTTKSSGLFIFASTIVRFIESDHHQPTERLKLILSQPSGTTYEGRSGIDSLYAQILAHAFPPGESEVSANINRVLGSIILAFNPLSRKELSTILGTSTSHISTILRHLHSVILVPPDETEKIRVFHKSFPDFLQDSGRCTDPRFHINQETCHSEMALGCLELVEKLEKNPCSLPPFTMNQDVRNLPLLLEDKLGGGVRYACSHWARHLRISRPPDVRAVIASATTVIEGATPWIEVMSLENQLGEVIHSLNNLLHWLDNTAGGDEFLSQLATDYLRTAMYFFYPIQQCAQHVYHTAILLSPSSSLLHNNQEWVAQDEILVTDYVNGPSNWGPLLTTISVGTRRLTSIATFAEKIAVACEDLVNIYDAATFALEQSSHTPQPVTRIQGSEDGSILYYTHSHSVTLWDIQTGGLIDTFHTRSEIIEVAVFPTDGHIACSLSDGSVAFRNYHTKNDGSFGNSESVVTIRWLSSAELVVATKSYVYVANIATGKFSNRCPFIGVWGVVLQSCGEMMVGTWTEDRFSYWTIAYELGWLTGRYPFHFNSRLLKAPPVISPISDKMIVAITPPHGVVVFDIEEHLLIRPPSLKEALSVAVSLGRHLVVQTEDSVQIFSIETLTNDVGPDVPTLSYISPLGEAYAVYLGTSRRLTVVKSGDLARLHPHFPPHLLTNWSDSPDSSCSRGFVAEFGALNVIEAWKSQGRLPRWNEADVEESALLGRLSPDCTRIVTLYGQPQLELQVKDANDGTILAKLSLEEDSFWGAGAAYDLIFDSELGFHLKVDGPGYHVRIPYDIIPSPSGQPPQTIKQGEPIPLSEPRTRLPYTLDASCEWVLDRQSRKICWIPPENMRRGNGGHFWVGTSLIMLGSDSIVRKLSFKKLD